MGASTGTRPVGKVVRLPVRKLAEMQLEDLVSCSTQDFGYRALDQGAACLSFLRF